MNDWEPIWGLIFDRASTRVRIDMFSSLSLLGHFLGLEKNDPSFIKEIEKYWLVSNKYDVS